MVRSKKTQAHGDGGKTNQVRLQKILADGGISSRRGAEKLILEGRVTVNGRVVSELGAKADPQRDHIKVDGKLLLRREPKVCILLNKPRGYVCTTRDEEGRPTVLDLVRQVRVRVYPVGRLDYNAEGALLLSNDGELAEMLMHPRYHVPKRYLVKVRGIPLAEQLRKLERGVMLEDGLTAPCEISLWEQRERSTWLEVTLYEGRYRQLHRMFGKIRHPAVRIKRIAYGCLTLEGLKPGQSRSLNPDELTRLRRMARKEC